MSFLYFIFESKWSRSIEDFGFFFKFLCVSNFGVLQRKIFVRPNFDSRFVFFWISQYRFHDPNNLLFEFLFNVSTKTKANK